MNVLVAVLLALLWTPIAYADEAKPTAESVRELLHVMQSERMLEGTFAQLQTMAEASSKQSLEGAPMNPEQQKIMADMKTKMLALAKEEVAWSKLEPMFVDIYRDTFTATEIKDMVAFYKSPTGQAWITKMPTVMQSTMQLTQRQMVGLAPKMKDLVAETAKRLAAARTK